MLLELIAALYDSSARLGAAKRLAEYLGSENLIVFIRDPNIDLMLPAPGFMQTVQNGPVWESFISSCNRKIFRGEVPYPDRNTLKEATGITGADGSIAVLIGGIPDEENLEPLMKLLPLITAVLKQEQEMIVHKSLTYTSEGIARKAEKVARSLEIIRQDLRKALIKQESDKKAIEDLMNKKDEFMNIASHELKTPLTSMRSYVQIIKRRLQAVYPDKQLLEFSDRASQQTNKLMLLVNDLFDLSKIQSGKLRFNLSTFNFNDLIKDCIEQTRNTTDTHQIMLQGEIRADFTGDRYRLEQVFTNLISNAVKYSPKADQVLIELAEKNGFIEVKVTDYGIGIDEKDLPNIAERFFRVEAIANNFDGLGLGLYISSQIIKGHHGEIIVESTINEGSTFTVLIPVAG